MGQLIAEEEGEGWEKKAKEAIEKFIKQYQGGRFTYISSGPFFHLPRETVFGVWVTAKTQETIQSGRALALTFTKNFLNELQNNEDTAKWYAYMCKTRPSWYSGKLSLKYVGIRIAFWDENVERPKAPYLSEIGFYADKFRYYEADPKTQALKLVLEESYSDALKHQQEAQAENKTGS
jgi:hypothetical protein